MRQLALCALMFLGACERDDGTPTTPDAAVAIDAAPDAMPHPDDGFGEPCTSMWNPDHLYTECTSLDGLPGICAIGACRRWCGAGCPTGQMPASTVENKCYCEPMP